MFLTATFLDMPSFHTHGNRLFGEVDGLLGAGRFKSSLLLCQSNFFPEKPRDLVISSLSSNRSMKLQEFRFLHFRAALYRISPLMSECFGRQNARPNVKKTRHTLS